MAAIFATTIAGATRGAAREEVPHLVHQDNADDDGVIPFVALPGKMLYRESDLRAALEKNYVAPFAHRNAEDFPAVYGRR